MVWEADRGLGKGCTWRMVLGAVALGTVVAGAALAPSAKADGWARDQRGYPYRVREDYRNHDWYRGREHEAWRHHEWRERHRYDDGYYAAPRVHYPHQYQGYYPGSFNITIPVR
ncbi:MAG: hypothetical protein JWM91_1884 [Rhodospirillales bacterium]|nr:hypothetical protein [Rhodospirillales bacterium]